MSRASGACVACHGGEVEVGELGERTETQSGRHLSVLWLKIVRFWKMSIVLVVCSFLLDAQYLPQFGATN
jgi:hypothetical protein